MQIRYVVKYEEPVAQIGETKYLTIQEAVEYSNIGETTIRKLLHEKGCPFLLKIGNRHLVKRKEFEKYIEKTLEI